VEFVVDKVALEQVFSEYFGFPCQSSFHRKFSILTIAGGRYKRAVNGRGAEWTQFGLHPSLCKLKIIIILTLRLTLIAQFSHLGIIKSGAEKKIWTLYRGNNRRTEKILKGGLNNV
jgi:hypothetical protein